MTSPVSCTEPGGNERWLRVSLAAQSLSLMAGERVLQTWSVSTARNGPGELAGSECTPRGWHVVRACIGDGLPAGAVLRGRRFTGEVCTPESVAAQPGRDWILTRILWLSGLEPGRNRARDDQGRTVDSMRRYIYIHGTPDSEPMGEPRSHGCVRMRNTDLLTLFPLAPAGTRVLITESP